MTGETTALHVWHAEARTLAEALSLAPAVHGGVALLATPRHYVVGVAGDGLCVDATGQPVRLDEVFEARCFTLAGELRWLADPRASQGRGTMALLAEDVEAGMALAAAGVTPSSIDAVATIGGNGADHGYLLWGRASRTAQGTVALSEGRIAPISVPADHLTAWPATHTPRIQLHVREYIALEPLHGNCYVAEERLLGLAWTD